MDVLAELVVSDGAPGLALDAEAKLSDSVVTMCCLDGFLVKGERVRELLDTPELLRSLGLVVTEEAMLWMGCLRGRDEEREKQTLLCGSKPSAWWELCRNHLACLTSFHFLHIVLPT